MDVLNDKYLASDRSDVSHHTIDVLKSNVKHEWAAVNAVNAAHVVNVCKAFKKRQEKMDETR